MRRNFRFLSVIMLILAVSYIPVTPAFAKHPLITDDTGTQGKGRTQLEVTSEVGFDKEKDDSSGKEATTESRESEVRATLSYGLFENTDLVLSVPYQWKKTEVDSATVSDVNGFADLSVEVKWQFFKKDGLSFAVKPGLIIPTGEKDKDLGTGRAGYTFFLIASKEKEPWELHANLGYKRNENDLSERKDIWHASLAGGWKIYEKLELVADIGVERNPDKETDTHPVFILGGVVYSVTENFDIDAGVKGGLNKAETDYAFLVGVTFRF